MKKKLTQQQRSVLAIVLTGLFLLTGKLFVWKSDKPVTAQPDASPVAEMPESAVTTEAPALTDAWPVLSDLSGSTETTVIVPIEPHSEETEPETLPSEPDAAVTVTTAEQEVPPVPETTVVTTEAVPAATAAPETEAPAEIPASDDYFKDVLFIGDSRTVGLASYAPIDGVTYFATVGLSTYKIDKAVSEVPGTKDQTFSQVLSAKQYGKVYIMLGINEIGNDFNYTIEHYRALVSQIQQKLPDAIIILEANLHVAYSRSATDSVVNNPRINTLNAELAGMADNRKIYYQDVNPVFDDENGCLKADYTSDGTHPYAKHYLTWSDWLRSHTIPV